MFVTVTVPFVAFFCCVLLFFFPETTTTFFQMLRRSVFLRPTAASSTQQHIMEAATAQQQQQKTSSSSFSASMRSSKFRLVSAAALVTSVPAIWYYTAVYRPRERLLEALQRQQKPERSTQTFATGTEPLSSVTKMLDEDVYRITFYFKACARMWVFAARSVYLFWLIVKHAVSTRFLLAASSKKSSAVVLGDSSSSSLSEEQPALPVVDGVTSISSNALVTDVAVAIAASTSDAVGASSSHHHHRKSKDDDIIISNGDNTSNASSNVIEENDPQLEAIGIELARVFSLMGGSYVKLGQWCATRADIFPREICESLEKLYDKALPHPWEDTEQMLKKWGLFDALESIDETPVSSGTIAQVYKARLKGEYAAKDEDRVNVWSPTSAEATAAAEEEVSRRTTATAPSNNKNRSSAVAAHVVHDEGSVDVAVKVMHPHIRSTLLEDIQALRWFSHIASAVVPGASYLGLTQAVEEFAALLYSQVDMVREAENLNEFRFNFRTSDNTVFPRPFLSLTNHDVLVETFEYGVALNSQTVSSIQHGTSHDFDDLGTTAVDMFCKMVFEHNLIHSDLHPGNILVRVINSDRSYTLNRTGPHSHSQLVVLDPGLVTSMSERERDNFIALFTCVATGDGDLGARLMLERSPEQHCKDVSSFTSDMKKVFDRAIPKNININDVDLAGIMQEILNTMRQHRVRIDMNFASLVASVALGEGLGRRLVTDFNLFEAAMPFLLHCLKSHELHYMISKLQETYLTASQF